jgi:hypothetical protein
MSDSATSLTVIVTAVALWFAHGTYLNIKLKEVHDKLDKVLDSFNGLRNYLYEIDPQFDDERASDAAVGRGDCLSGMDAMELLNHKKESGKRHLGTPFVESE